VDISPGIWNDQNTPKTSKNNGKKILIYPRKQSYMHRDKGNTAADPEI
jgi:hypothetical protein